MHKRMMRFLLGVYLLYSFFVLSMFKSTLLSVLTISPVEPKIDTSEKILKSGLPYGINDWGGGQVKYYKCNPNPV